MTHIFHLEAMKPQAIRASGSRAEVSASEFPALKYFAMALLSLEPKGVREPHWHPNANELSYCLEGKGLMTIFTPSAGHETFTIRAGEIAFVPLGYLHHIENTGETPLRLLACFDNENLENMEISASVAGMSLEAMGAVFSLPTSFFSGLDVKKESVVISSRQTSAKPIFPRIPNRFKYDLEGSTARIQTEGGWVKVCNSSLLTPLKGLTVYSLSLMIGGVREPHWHPNAGECNYLLQGRVRIILLFPGGGEETFEMSAGDISFLPQGYFHSIENIGQEEARFVIFFNNTEPSDIGISGALGAYSNEVLASIFGVQPSYFEKMTKFQEDVRVVPGGG